MIKSIVIISIRGVAQPGSASALGAEGRVFESLRPDHIDMKYIIYKNKKSPTQSGKLHKEFWVLEHVNTKDVKIVEGPTVKLSEISKKRVKRRTIQLVRRPI